MAFWNRGSREAEQRVAYGQQRALGQLDPHFTFPPASVIVSQGVVVEATNGGAPDAPVGARILLAYELSRWTIGAFDEMGASAWPVGDLQSSSSRVYVGYGEVSPDGRVLTSLSQAQGDAEIRKSVVAFAPTSVVGMALVMSKDEFVGVREGQPLTMADAEALAQARADVIANAKNRFW